MYFFLLLLFGQFEEGLESSTSLIGLSAGFLVEGSSILLLVLGGFAVTTDSEPNIRKVRNALNDALIIQSFCL